MNIFKLIVSAFSAMLIVSSIIVVLVAVTAKHDDNVNWEDKKSPLRRAVSQLCAPTSFTDLCIETLNRANTSDPRELIKAMIIRSHEAIAKLHELAESMAKEFENVTTTNNMTTTDSMTALDRLDDISSCMEMLQLGMVDLQKTMDIIEANQLETLNYQADEIMAKLNAVITFQKACLNGFRRKSKPEKEKLMGPMQESRQLGSIALTTIYKLPWHLQYFNIKEQLPPSNILKRFQTGEVSEFKLPPWFKTGHRKLLATPKEMLIPSAVVAQDGTGQFFTISSALQSYPDDMKEGMVYAIYVKAGVYEEQVIMKYFHRNVFIYGDGNTKTYVTFDSRLTPSEHLGIENSATFAVLAEGFLAREIGFVTTSGPDARRSSALYVRADKAVFVDCTIDGYQRTLNAQAYRQFYLNCIISGTRDFITGDATAVIQNSWILVRRPNRTTRNIVTAHARDLKSQTTAFVLQKCVLLADKTLWEDRFKIKTFLGRPLGPYATTVFLENNLGDFIDPEGYLPWDNGTHMLFQGFRFFEHNNNGPSANTTNRVKWSGVKEIDKNEALQFTVSSLLDPRDQWMRYMKIEYPYNVTIS